MGIGGGEEEGVFCMLIVVVFVVLACESIVFSWHCEHALFCVDYATYAFY